MSDRLSGKCGVCGGDPDDRHDGPGHSIGPRTDAMSDPNFAEVLAGCTSIESAKDAWVRFGAPAWRDLLARAEKAEAALASRAAPQTRDPLEEPDAHSGPCVVTHGEAHPYYCGLCISG